MKVEAKQKQKFLTERRSSTVAAFITLIHIIVSLPATSHAFRIDWPRCGGSICGAIDDAKDEVTGKAERERRERATAELQQASHQLQAAQNELIAAQVALQDAEAALASTRAAATKKRAVMVEELAAAEGKLNVLKATTQQIVTEVQTSQENLAASEKNRLTIQQSTQQLLLGYTDNSKIETAGISEELGYSLYVNLVREMIPQLPPQRQTEANELLSGAEAAEHLRSSYKKNVEEQKQLAKRMLSEFLTPELIASGEKLKERLDQSLEFFIHALQSCEQFIANSREIRAEAGQPVP